MKAGLLLFETVRNVLRENIKWEMLFADDLLVTAKTKEDLERKVFQRHEELASGRLQVNSGQALVVVSSKQEGDINTSDDL